MDIRDSCFHELYNLMSDNNNVIFMTADTDAFVIRDIQRDFPDRFIDIGVSEQAAIDVAAGLALNSKKVFVYAIASFITGRCYEHIRSVVCGMKLPVFIIGAGAGLSFSKDGPTHHATHDIALMRTLPGMTIYSSCDEVSIRNSVRSAFQNNVPAYIRLDKGEFPVIRKTDSPFEIIRPLQRVNLVSTGYMTHVATRVADAIGNLGVIDISIITDYPLNWILGDKCKKLIVIEESCMSGALGTLMLELFEGMYDIFPISLPNTQISRYGSREYLHQQYRIDYESVLAKVKWMVS